MYTGPVLLCNPIHLNTFQININDKMLQNLIKMIESESEHLQVTYNEFIQDNLTMKDENIQYEKKLSDIQIHFKSSIDEPETHFIINQLSYTKTMTTNIITQAKCECPLGSALSYFTSKHLPEKFYDLMDGYLSTACSHDIYHVTPVETYFGIGTLKSDTDNFGSWKRLTMYDYHQLYKGEDINLEHWKNHEYSMLSIAIFYMLHEMTFKEQLIYVHNLIKTNIITFKTFLSNAIYYAWRFLIVNNNIGWHAIFTSSTDKVINNNYRNIIGIFVNKTTELKIPKQQIYQKKGSSHLNIYYFIGSVIEALDPNKSSFVIGERIHINEISHSYITSNNTYESGNFFNYYMCEVVHTKLNTGVPLLSVTTTGKSNSLTELIVNNSKTNYTKPEMVKKISEFLIWIENNSKRQNANKKVNIYTIKVEKTEKVEKIVNEEYTDYINMKSELLKNKDNTEENILKILGKPPLQTNNKTIIEKTIETSNVNNRYASFDNLYLQKCQDTYLYGIVDTFQNDKVLMTELGIPNKLGILLYGEPGCGKTTTIVTIASYFGRDIFYINLKSVSTNDELKMIFDHINTKHAGGGIVVLEDIDAMTSIVNKRVEDGYEDIGTINLMETTSNSITLEYLLNLLDGTLTYNDSIVVITTNHLEKLDPALYRAGRIDNLIEMKKCDHYQITKIFKRFMQRELAESILNKIPENKYTPAQIIFHLKQWVKKRQESDETIMANYT